MSQKADCQRPSLGGRSADGALAWRCELSFARAQVREIAAAKAAVDFEHTVAIPLRGKTASWSAAAALDLAQRIVGRRSCQFFKRRNHSSPPDLHRSRTAESERRCPRNRPAISSEAAALLALSAPRCPDVEQHQPDRRATSIDLTLAGSPDQPRSSGKALGRSATGIGRRWSRRSRNDAVKGIPHAWRRRLAGQIHRDSFAVFMGPCCCGGGALGY